MPKANKRKRADSDGYDYESIAKQLKLLQEKLEETHSQRHRSQHGRRRRLQVIESSSSSSSSRSVSIDRAHMPDNLQGEKMVTTEFDTAAEPLIMDTNPQDHTLGQILDAGLSSAPTLDVIVQNHDAPDEDALDNDVLQILGDDPTATVTYGKEIHKELINRFEHASTSGLTKEVRRELCDKYLVPSNCIRVGAPKLNAEIKAALNESLIKRDKVIEAKQKQLAAAVSCLAQVATEQLASKNTNHDLLRKILDAGRLICDVQYEYTESITRRNFAAFSLKKDMKEHLLNTKIDTSLFGETLPDTLKSAKAVCKSGTELKGNTSSFKKTRPTTSAQKPQPIKNLNWKTPAPARRQPGPQRGRQPAPHRSQPETSSKQSSYQQRSTRRQ